jgi:hypothetical protein
MDPAELEIALGYNNPDCLDSNEDFSDEADCEAQRCNDDARYEYYEFSDEGE